MAGRLQEESCQSNVQGHQFLVSSADHQLPGITSRLSAQPQLANTEIGLMMTAYRNVSIAESSDPATIGQLNGA
jgi:hypothetical protein